MEKLYCNINYDIMCSCSLEIGCLKLAHLTGVFEPVSVYTWSICRSTHGRAGARAFDPSNGAWTCQSAAAAVRGEQTVPTPAAPHFPSRRNSYPRVSIYVDLLMPIPDNCQLWSLHRCHHMWPLSTRPHTQKHFIAPSPCSVFCVFFAS